MNKRFCKPKISKNDRRKKLIKGSFIFLHFTIKGVDESETEMACIMKF